MSAAKKTFRMENPNTYRGYFPAQAGSDNLKEGLEIGPKKSLPQTLDVTAKFNLVEQNVWPESFASSRERAEVLHEELQSLSSQVLSLLALALGKDASHFEPYLENSISTLRLLHYPTIIRHLLQQELCCTPHTDSGILTLLHQDETGGLEILSTDGQWVPAPYVPGSIVVNVGDLMSKVSGGKFRATHHRVRSSPGKSRYSVAFFFEPGAECLVNNLDDDKEPSVLYGSHVLEKMIGWVEFQDLGKKRSCLEDG